MRLQATAILILFKRIFVEQLKVYLVIGSLCKETLNRSNKVISLLYGAQWPTEYVFQEQ